MSFLTKPASILRSAAVRPALFTAPRARLQVRFATQDYGSGDGNPAGESPQQQGASQSEHLEHPGPAPPKVAQGKSSSSPNNDDSSTSQSSSSGSSSSKQSKKSQQSKRSDTKDPAVQQGQENSGGSKGAKPKILGENSPAEKDQSADVKKHNKDMENRTDRAHEQVDK